MKRNQTSTAEADDFLSRWSRRKQEARAAGETLPPELPAEPEADAGRLLTDEDMPPLESLEASSDFSGFMSPKVSEELRRLALKKLFHSAAFNSCDGLDDYAEDFTSFAKLGDIITADMRFQAEEAAKRMGAEGRAAQAEAAEERTEESRAEVAQPDEAPVAEDEFEQVDESETEDERTDP